MVIIKILVLLFFVIVALKYVSPAQMAANWHPFQPNGWKGTFAGIQPSGVTRDPAGPAREVTPVPGGVLGVLALVSYGPRRIGRDRVRRSGDLWFRR